MDAGEQIAKGIVGPKVAIRYVGKLHPSSTESFRAPATTCATSSSRTVGDGGHVSSANRDTRWRCPAAAGAALRAVAVAAGRVSPE
jgi:hypothetical protein